ncbi:hypothetical protein IID04_05960 [PVC group bacterium]|nr:hypothetical protein [PVC group bacterium]
MSLLIIFSIGLCLAIFQSTLRGFLNVAGIVPDITLMYFLLSSKLYIRLTKKRDVFFELVFIGGCMGLVAGMYSAVSGVSFILSYMSLSFLIYFWFQNALAKKIYSKLLYPVLFPVVFYSMMGVLGWLVDGRWIFYSSDVFFVSVLINGTAYFLMVGIARTLFGTRSREFSL